MKLFVGGELLNLILVQRLNSVNKVGM